MERTKETTNDTNANLGFEAKLWAAADALRNNVDAAEYKHAELAAQQTEGADPEDRDEYRAASIFWVPKEARWQGHSLAMDGPKKAGRSVA